MIFMFIALYVLLTSVSCFALSYQVNGINRLVVNFPISILENTVDMVVDSPGVIYFDIDKADALVSDYFEANLIHYTNDFSYDTYYYNIDDHSYCSSDRCQAVEISIEATLLYNFEYRRTMYYEIVENWYG